MSEIIRTCTIIDRYILQERLLSYKRLENDIQVAHQPLSLALARRVLSRWRWYGCSLLVSQGGSSHQTGTIDLFTQTVCHFRRNREFRVK
jgi:hypothetical protein